MGPDSGGLGEKLWPQHTWRPGAEHFCRQTLVEQQRPLAACPEGSPGCPGPCCEPAGAAWDGHYRSQAACYPGAHRHLR